MLVKLVEATLLIVGGYAIIGLLVAFALQARGLHSIDPATRGAGLGFRILVTPGLVALWPILVGKWRRAAAGTAQIPDPDRPVSPRGLRKTQSTTWRLVTVGAVVVATLGLIQRPPMTSEPRSEALALLTSDPGPLPTVLRELGTLFPDLPIEARLRGADSGGAIRQLELDVKKDLAIPTLALYWCPLGTRTESAPGAGAIFVGTVWGPETLRFSLGASIAGDGEWVLYSIARATTIAVAAGTLEGGTP